MAMALLLPVMSAFSVISIVKSALSFLITAQSVRPAEPNNLIGSITIFLVNIHVQLECGEMILIMSAIFVKFSASIANMPLIIVMNVIKLLAMPGKITHAIAHVQLVLF